jgi:hypothetical protein
MRRRGLFLVTMLTLVFSAISMARAGWFGAPRGRAAHRAAQLHSQARAFDPMGSQAAWRYIHGQHSNWRSVMLYR